MVEIGLHTGLRVQEIAQLKVSDLFIQNHHSSILVRSGKGGKRRSVWISEKFKAICKAYLSLREKFGGERHQDTYLLSLSNKAYASRTFQKAFKRILRKADLSSHYHIHCLRHTYATYLLRVSRNLKLVKEQLGHTSINATDVYISLIRDDTQKALEHLYRKELGI